MTRLTETKTKRRGEHRLHGMKSARSGRGIRSDEEIAPQRRLRGFRHHEDVQPGLVLVGASERQPAQLLAERGGQKLVLERLLAHRNALERLGQPLPAVAARKHEWYPALAQRLRDTEGELAVQRWKK